VSLAALFMLNRNSEREREREQKELTLVLGNDRKLLGRWSRTLDHVGRSSRVGQLSLAERRECAVQLSFDRRQILNHQV
jgi:hypothetical protein